LANGDIIGRADIAEPIGSGRGESYDECLVVGCLDAYLIRIGNLTLVEFCAVLDGVKFIGNVGRRLWVQLSQPGVAKIFCHHWLAIAPLESIAQRKRDSQTIVRNLVRFGSERMNLSV